MSPWQANHDSSQTEGKRETLQVPKSRVHNSSQTEGKRGPRSPAYTQGSAARRFLSDRGYHRHAASKTDSATHMRYPLRRSRTIGPVLPRTPSGTEEPRDSASPLALARSLAPSLARSLPPSHSSPPPPLCFSSPPPLLLQVLESIEIPRSAGYACSQRLDLFGPSRF